MSFDTRKDDHVMDISIIKEYTKESYYNYLNKNLKNPKDNSSDVFAYFASRLMYSLNNYAKNNKMFFDKDKTIIWGGISIPYSSLLTYERAVNKIITFPEFTSIFESEKVANCFARAKENNFSVILIVKINHQKTWISNGINIQKLSRFSEEREILFQCFSFFYLKKIKIDINNKAAHIYLETIGKKEILEKELKNGKTIIYNEKNNIMELI